MKFAVSFFIFLTIISQTQAAPKKEMEGTDCIVKVGNDVNPRGQNNEDLGKESLRSKENTKKSSEWAIHFFRGNEYLFEDYVELCIHAISVIRKDTTGLRFVLGTPYTPVKLKLTSKL